MPRRPKVATPPAAAPEEPVTKELAVVEDSLPGFADVDGSLLDEAVDEINRIYISKGLELYFAVGEYILDSFFGGHPDTFHRRGKGHATFRALAERPDLRMSYSTLYNAVAVVNQRRLLPEKLTEALPFTHQKLLLPVRDEAAKVDLARKALDKGLTSRELAEEVKRVRAAQREGAKRGRPNLPACVKALGRLGRIRDQATAEPITAEAFAAYGPEKAQVLLDDVEHWIRGLQETVDRVRGVIADIEAEHMAEKVEHMAEKVEVEG